VTDKNQKVRLKFWIRYRDTTDREDKEALQDTVTVQREQNRDHSYTHRNCYQNTELPAPNGHMPWTENFSGPKNAMKTDVKSATANVNCLTRKGNTGML